MEKEEEEEYLLNTSYTLFGKRQRYVAKGGNVFSLLVYYSWAFVAIRAWTSISTLLSVFHSAKTQSLFGTLTVRP